MSLVAYDYNSDEESDHDELDEQPVAPVAVLSIETSNVPESNIKVTPPQQSTPTSDDTIADEEESVVHLPLPAPKKITINNLNVEEEDDEFLHKKAIPEVKPTLPPPPPSLASARSNIKNGKVQITIPSLKDFKEDNDIKPKPKPTVSAQLPERATGLLGMLPKPKSEISFSTSSSAKNGPAPASVKPIVNRLIPDSVANRPRNVHPDSKLPKKPFQKNQNTLPKSSAKDDESSDDDEEKIDFFSLNMDEKLPEISSNEINAMVAKRAARMAAAVEKFDKPSVSEQEPGPSGFHQVHSPSLPNPNDLANEQALSSLIGGNKAKRARLDEVNIIDINSEDIVPSKEDFMRRKLQEETGYVPTGHLTGDWTCTSKRKSHITYLASKAQANAQELEAMWSANRQSRRQTQSKYGF